LEDDEREQYFGRVKKLDESREKLTLPTDDLPDSIDWRELGGVNAIRDQGACGSCYTFGSVCSLEGAHFVATGELLELAESQLVDCSSAYGNGGCNGGLEIWCFAYYEDYNAILRKDYPYVPI